MRKRLKISALLGLIGVILVMTGCAFGQNTSDGNINMVRIDMTEDEIRNMSDEDFKEYGLLLIQDLIEDVQTRNPQREEFGFTHEEGYRYAGMPAGKSASDYDEALKIAGEEWQDNDLNQFTDIALLGENDKFWLFKCDNYYKGEFNLICTTVVYKKDYYDEKSRTAYFELNEENIRTFFAYRSPDPEDQYGAVIGEFVIRTDEGYVFRRYSLQITYGDHGLNDEANLYMYEAKISNEGKVDRLDYGDYRRSVTLPVSTIGDPY